MLSVIALPSLMARLFTFPALMPINSPSVLSVRRGLTSLVLLASLPTITNFGLLALCLSRMVASSVRMGRSLILVNLCDSCLHTYRKEVGYVGYCPCHRQVSGVDCHRCAWWLMFLLFAPPRVRGSFMNVVGGIMEFVTRFSARTRAGVVFTQPSRTKQSFAHEADINSIMARYNATGCLVDPAVQARATRRPFWADVSGIPDYQSMRNTIARADQEFSMLPARLRERFGNDPAQLLAFLADESNRDEAVKLGLVQAVEAVEEAAPTDQPGAPITPHKAESEAVADTRAQSLT